MEKRRNHCEPSPEMIKIREYSLVFKNSYFKISFCILRAYVMVQHLEVLVSQPLLNVPLSASEVVVHHKYLDKIDQALFVQIWAQPAKTPLNQIVANFFNYLLLFLLSVTKKSLCHRKTVRKRWSFHTRGC